MKIYRNSAFSLVECLITVAILAVLASLLVPQVSKMRGLAQSSKCLSNLRQLAGGCIAYSGDHDGTLIPICDGVDASSAKTWRALIEPYVGKDPQVFRCPSDPNAISEIWYPSGIAPASYGLNYTKVLVNGAFQAQLNSYMGRTSSGVKLASVKKPSGTIMVSDMGFVENPAEPIERWKEKSKRGGNYGYVRFPSDYDFAKADSWDIYPRHSNRSANVAFYDGHVESVNLMQDIVPHPPGDPKCIYDNE